jgi:hypothetical protein
MTKYKPRVNSNSLIKILQHPIEGEVYIAGIDPIPIITRKESDDTSFYAIAIYRMSTRQFVAYYMERSKDASKLVGNSTRLQKYFNDATAMIERNRGDAIIMEYDRLELGIHKLLHPEPADWRPAGAKSIEVGYFKSIHNADLIDNFMLDWARWFDEERGIGGIEGIWDLTLWEHVYSHNIGNKDLGDACKAALVLEWWILEKKKRKKQHEGTPATTKKVYINTMENGRTVQKLVTVETSRFPAGFKKL